MAFVIMAYGHVSHDEPTHVIEDIETREIADGFRRQWIKVHPEGMAYLCERVDNETVRLIDIAVSLELGPSLN